MSGAAGPCVAVLDVGKTNVKVALVDAASLREVASRRMPNRPRAGPYPHADVEAQWGFILTSLRELAAEGPVEAVSVAAHGATAALIDERGALALPVLDYEHDGPDSLAPDYDAARPPFAETGSPRLPQGLNLGAQLLWLQRCFPERFSTARTLLTWPQYWSWRLSGVAASEVTSLGCHTDLWDPWRARPSSLAVAQGWDRLLPPLRRASDRLGPLRPGIVARAGLAPATPVLCGIHDSNASLLPHLLARTPPFAVVSTGTWVVAMAVGAGPVPLDPSRDVLVNVDAFGTPVPSARFMGGRERERVLAGRVPAPTDDDRAAVLRDGVMLLPAAAPSLGPTSGGRWTRAPATDGALGVALSWSLALTTAACLDLVGAEGDVVVEGPFAADADYLAMLRAATGRPVHAGGGDASGTSAGAALLWRGASPVPPAALVGRAEPALRDYAARWRARAVTLAGRGA